MKNKRRKLIRYFSLGGMALITLSACQKDPVLNIGDPGLFAEMGEEYSGGANNTVFDVSENAFSFASPALGGIDELEFFVGNSYFNQNWVTAPASTQARDGLGPNFNARSCSGCHFKDGRGRAPEFNGEMVSGLLIRLSIPGIGPHGEPMPDPKYGGQLNDQAVMGITPEGQFDISYVEITGQFEDGEPYNLRKPAYTLTNLGYGTPDGGLMMSPRVGQQIIGLGLLEAISETDLLKYADAGDANGDGISGRPNYVWDVEAQTNRLGRFGWKANQPSLKQQTAGAFLGDIGITTPLFLDENCTSAEYDCQGAANGGSPELIEEDLEKVVKYVANLAVPARRNFESQKVLKGKEIFNKIGCNGCHVPSYYTSTHPQFSHLSNQRIWPYTDLLLHDMGDELADNRPDFQANGNEWRTPPLWGVGLFQTVNHHTNYLHDGRARNLMEAVLWHGGEAETSKNKVLSLSKEERENLILFLESL